MEPLVSGFNYDVHNIPMKNVADKRMNRFQVIIQILGQFFAVDRGASL